jgi:phosphoribosyl-dephospho-CoA transferase
MRFALDVDFLDADGRLLRRVEAVPPRRVVHCRRGAAVLERTAR